MSNKLKNSKKAPAIDRPFDPEILRQARAIVDQYQIVIRLEDGEYFGHGLEFPEAWGDGKNVEECVRSVRESLLTGVAYMLESGQVPPPPADEEKRTEQVNVRLSVKEKIAIEASARRKGFDGMGDFIRTMVLASLL